MARLVRGAGWIRGAARTSRRCGPCTPAAAAARSGLRTGDDWVHLRICMSCGHVGCCDDSKNRHATAHFAATEHPVMRSIEPGETWGWCYVDRVEL